jgi:hypothetical protein
MNHLPPLPRLACRLLCGLLLLASLPVAAQDSPSQDHFDLRVGASMRLAQQYGPLKDANRQYASDQNTLFGQQASYAVPWQVGGGLNVEASYWISDFFGGMAGLSLHRVAISEVLTIGYDPAFQGYQRKQESLDQQLNYAAPQLGLVARWKGVRLQAGLQADLFLYGRSTWRNTLSKTDGTEEVEEDAARLDVQDQVIFLSADGESVVADFSATSAHNHGANPVVLSAFTQASYTLWDDRPSPYIGFAWYFPIQEAIRSRNTRYGLRNFLEPPYAQDIAQGTLIKSMAFSIGYQF